MYFRQIAENKTRKAGIIDKIIIKKLSLHKLKERNKKVIYTAPIKALCNQKLYDLRLKYPEISFGILTGDIKMNPDADCIIMTTEILLNMLIGVYPVQQLE